MDTMRGHFGSLAGSESYDPADEDIGHPVPPLPVGQDERRMQVRAYNHWAGLLGDRSYPAIDDLELEALPDFGPYSVLLDFTNGTANPGIVYIGAELAAECGVSGEELQALSDVPPQSLLTRITEQYMQILASQAPIGFEAEFVNQRGATILYRGILMPFSSDDDTIDFIYGVINWKELADAQAADELLLEIDQALEPAPVANALGAGASATVPANDLADESHAGAAAHGLPMPAFGYDENQAQDKGRPAWAGLAPEEENEDEDPDEDETGAGASFGSLLKMPLSMPRPGEKAAVALPESGADEMAFAAPEPLEPDTPELDPAEMGLDDWLAAARDMAAVASGSEDRTRRALYEAIGRAYDFSLAAAEAPADFQRLLAEASLAMQDRAPMTPVVKLVFGAGYDRTRLTEYAAALSHAHRLRLPLGTLGAFLGEHEGGLKGVVRAERRLRKEEAGKVAEPAGTPGRTIARKLRALPARDFAAIDPAGCEFALVMIRRSGTGEVALLGEVPADGALVERAARRLIG